MTFALIAVCLAATALMFLWRRQFPDNDVLKVTCPACSATNRLTGSMCPQCNTRERILLRKGAPKGADREMQILLYHCGCSSRMLFCDLKCTACGAQISDDRRTELRPLDTYDATVIVTAPQKQNSGQEVIASLPAAATTV